MNSEKVKEIKKALECCQGESLKSCEHCPYWNWCKEDDGLTFKSDILTLINELESENERLNKALVDNLEAYKDGFNEGAVLKKGVDNKLKTENQQLKDRIAELENGIAQSMLGCEFLPECTDKKLKQFAERLKEKATWSFIMCGDHKAGAKTVTLHDIDETLKEFMEVKE